MVHRPIIGCELVNARAMTASSCDPGACHTRKDLAGDNGFLVAVRWDCGLLCGSCSRPEVVFVDLHLRETSVVPIVCKVQPFLRRREIASYLKGMGRFKRGH